MSKKAVKAETVEVKVRRNRRAWKSEARSLSGALTVLEVHQDRIKGLIQTVKAKETETLLQNPEAALVYLLKRGHSPKDILAEVTKA